MSVEIISIIGLGYIGLPTAAVFASRKKKVIGVDVNQDVVNTINRGEIHIVEPELDMVVHAAVHEGYLQAVTKPKAADAFLIAVPTPFKNNHEPNLDYIEAASKAIAPVLKTGNIIILESTVPVGATEQMAEWMAKARPDLTFPQSHGEESDIRIAHCPERVLPGHVLRELIQNDRIVGGMTLKCSRLAAEIYKTFVEGECIITDTRTAEMTKLTENSFRDVNIAFANELSMICDKLNIDVRELIKLANHHPRVDILQPGCGVGGHCIAVDPWFIVSKTPDEAQLIHTARKVNDFKPKAVVAKIIQKAESLNVKKITCLGIAFKPDIDDLRESPALEIVTMLVNNGFDVDIVEPNISLLPKTLQHKNINLVSLDSVIISDSEGTIAILVAHKEFKSAAISLKTTLPLDFCGILN